MFSPAASHAATCYEMTRFTWREAIPCTRESVLVSHVRPPGRATSLRLPNAQYADAAVNSATLTLAGRLTRYSTGVPAVGHTPI
jgi:hypothetical protein